MRVSELGWHAYYRRMRCNVGGDERIGSNHCVVPHDDFSHYDRVGRYVDAITDLRGAALWATARDPDSDPLRYIAGMTYDSIPTHKDIAEVTDVEAGSNDSLMSNRDARYNL